jgi:hypothetical protein
VPKSQLFRALIAVCVAGVGFSIGACEDPVPDYNGSERKCAMDSESCDEICGTSECTVDKGAGCAAPAIAYEDLESCEANEPGIGTVLDEVLCDDSFGMAGEGKYIACCCNY